MRNSNKLAIVLVVCLLAANTAIDGHAFAADSKKAKDTKTKPAKSSVPIVIEADKLYFSDATGDLFANGNVVVVQDKQKVLAQEVKGNTKETQIWIDDKANFIDPQVDVIGIHTHYNYGTKTGTMLKATGKIGRERVVADNIDLLPDKYILHDGTMTKCPAAVPDYRITADKVVIWPGEKLIAYNAKFWIKNTVIYSRAVYQKSLRDDEQSEFPQIGYDSDDGAYIRQYLEHPLGNNVAVFADLGFYSKAKFKPSYGMIDRERNYDLSMTYGDNRDADSRWIKKEPEFRFDYRSHRLGSLPVSYTFTGIYGKWTDNVKTSWHQDYILYFTRDPIKLSPTLTLNMGTGYEVVKESYDGSNLGTFRFNTSLHKAWSPKFSTWAGYNFTQNNNTLFDYNRTNVAKEMLYGFTYKIDRMNTVAFYQSYDLQNSRVYENYYTWYRNLHCWQMELQYKAKEKRLQWNISVLRW